MTIRVLVVDDSATVRYELTRQLGAAEMEVDEARNGQDALGKLGPNHGFDVIVSDLRMPGIDGLTLVNTLQNAQDLQLIPVCILTSSTDMDDHIGNLEAGASAYIVKPWNEDILVATVKRLARQKEKQTALRHASRTDPLTGLANRRSGDARLTEEIARSRRYGRDMAVAMIDIDHFKGINDRLGHAAGDEVLEFVSAELRSVSRETDLVVRWGGEEFLFVFPETAVQDAALIVERFRAHLASRPVHVKASGGSDLTVTVSGGVAGLEEHDEADTLVSRADSALYEAKKTGRNRLLMWQLGQLEPVVAAA
jgi:diguanylate cyclase (GGDEF)-like protein